MFLRGGVTKMNQLKTWAGFWCAGVTALVVANAKPTYAATFGQAEVNQRNFVAVAVPRTSGNHTLLVIEQRSRQRRCWRERGTAPTQIDPLLLKFNFTGICGRSTDSNGYSVRIASRDLGMTYRLSLQKRQNDLVLMAAPSPDSSDPPLVIGRTRGLGSGLLKIVLNPGWRFTLRTYQGKFLDHIYFSRR
jgi:Protein of unknown function (DUF3747)